MGSKCDRIERLIANDCGRCKLKKIWGFEFKGTDDGRQYHKWFYNVLLDMLMDASGAYISSTSSELLLAYKFHWANQRINMGEGISVFLVSHSSPTIIMVKFCAKIFPQLDVSASLILESAHRCGLFRLEEVDRKDCLALIKEMEKYNSLKDQVDLKVV